MTSNFRAIFSRVGMRRAKRLTSTSSIISSPSYIRPKVKEYGFWSLNNLSGFAGLNIRLVMEIASGPETRMLPIAPPWAVAMAQIVSWFIIFSFEWAKIRVSM